MGKSPHGSRAGAFAALSYPNYRLWFVGQMISLFGTWMQSTAQGYLVFELTRSSAYLGYVGFASGFATLAFTLFGGVVADRVPRRNLLVVTQALSMLLALVLSFLAFAGVVEPWQIIILAFLLGVVNAFDVPARQSFVLEMVSREDLTNAIALNATMFNAALAVGPAVGGLAYAFFGPGWCFLINGVSFVAVIVALLAMRLPPFAPQARAASLRDEVMEGFRVIGKEGRILSILLLIGAVSVFGMSFATLLPAWAVRVLGGDARTNGFLNSARGFGAFSAAVFIASLGRFKFKGKLLTWGSFAFPAMLLFFSFTRALPLSLILLVLVGAANITLNNLCNSVVQGLVPDAVRGRVMAIYNFVFLGFMPIGALAAGVAAQGIGESVTLAVGAVLTLACSLAVFLAVPALRKTE